MSPFEVRQTAGELVIGVRVDELALVRAGERDAMQRRHGGVDVPVLDERAHVPVEQREQQDADMGAVHVGIGHHDDLVVAGLLDVETGAGSRTDHLDDRGALLVVEHLAQRCLLHVEYLASDRQQRLESGIARSLGRAERGVALDDEQLGHIVVARLAVGQFRRHGGGFERVLAARDLLGLARLDAGVHLADNLLQHTTGLLLVAAFGARDHRTACLSSW